MAVQMGLAYSGTGEFKIEFLGKGPGRRWMMTQIFDRILDHP